MQDLIVQTIEQFGYLAVFLLITLENVFPPIPSEIVLSFAGFATKHSSMGVFGVVTAATLGSVLGALILYAVGRLLTPERLRSLLDGRVGKILHFNADDMLAAEKWFRKRGPITVLVCRCIPIVRSLISIPAGMSKMPLLQFTALTTLGTLVWNTVLVYFGRAAGHAWPHIVAVVDRYAYASLAVLLIIAIVVYIWLGRRKKRAAQE
ncbi:DedA family protein [Lacticaseibacillus songhuajiangensis]|jgi:membrane protein DedA with SNARE-associated domain|uniref:DedA family protein n=1 Tax=Lacticaseibacillus songhuajiangensis TaxID=1296539 RepID=UPI000F768376|nr:DedA family protein [Lacticaseibacillus songhuajiangensis]